MDSIIKIVRGSQIYGTANESSDIDILKIVPDEASLMTFGEIQEDGYAHYVERKDSDFNKIHNFRVDHDYIVMTYSQFKHLIDSYDIMAIEALYSNHDLDGNRKEIEDLKYKSIDTWKLRQTISAITNNSWAKCHKKLTVEKDYDLYCGQKSLFHVLRIYLYGIQLASTGRIEDFSCTNKTYNTQYKSLKDLYDAIMNDPITTWDHYKEKFQPYRNMLATEFKKYCPKEI